MRASVAPQVAAIELLPLLIVVSLWRQHVHTQESKQFSTNMFKCAESHVYIALRDRLGVQRNASAHCDTATAATVTAAH
jgi:hypothetical protein